MKEDPQRRARRQTVWALALTAAGSIFTFVSQLIALGENGLTQLGVVVLLLSPLLAVVCIILIFRFGRRNHSGNRGAGR